MQVVPLMRRLAIGVATWLYVCAPATALGAATNDYVWWEGENPTQTNFPTNKPFGPQNLDGNAHLLSNGDWLNASGKRGPEALFAKYRVEVPADGEYSLWVRKFWKHGPFKWRFGADEWRVCDKTFALADDTPIKKFVNANWVSLGKVGLTKGPKVFEVELLAKEGEDSGAGFDCFLLTRGPFVPNGKTRPGESTGKAEEGYFPFEPATDKFTSDALLDLRSLNEKSAGQAGFIKRQGMGFTTGDGKPVRFWAVNVNAANAGQDRQAVDYLARKLAKLGVNMVRYHSAAFDKGDPSKVDPKALDDLLYLVSAMKKQGIYTYLSFYFPMWMEANKPGAQLAGYESLQNKRPFGLLFFDPRMQEMHRTWLKALLETKSPYTNLPLGRDPAVGIVEVQNEDSLFFWTFTKKNIPSGKWADLERLYARWLVARYGSVAKAVAAWGGASVQGDGQDRAALLEAYHMTSEGLKVGGPGKVKRVGDQARFLAELQRDFYARTTKYIKQDLKFGGLVNACNWTVADPNLTGAIERWTYTAGDVIDVHGYFGGEHKGDGAEFSVRVGHTFKDAAAVLNPGKLPLRFQQIEGLPQIITELGFPQPNRYRADGVFLSSAYGSLQGADGLFFFIVNSNYLRDTAMQKFPVASPAISAAFPAAALVYRRGDVKEAQPVVHQVLNPDDLFAMKGSGGWSADALDEFRRRDLPPGANLTGGVSKIEEMAPYVGPVVRAFGGDPARGWRKDLSRYIDREKQTVTSLTGELRWDFGRGVAVMDTPKAQGAAGFLGKAGEVTAANLKVNVANEFATVTAVSLDNLPLASSRKVLVQVMTQEQPYGFRTEGDRIVNLGGAPFGVKKIEGTAELLFTPGSGGGGSGSAKVVALDENGYATRKSATAKAGNGAGSLVLPLLEDVIYYVVTR
jgi:hypothetical protein